MNSRTAPPTARPSAAARPPETVSTRRPLVSSEDRARFEALRSMLPNPEALPPNTRSVDEEAEFRKLSQIVAEADRQAALDAARPEAQPDPKQRLAELKRKDRTEGEGIEHRRLEELLADEARVDVLKRKDKRSHEEDAELVMLQARTRDARAAGGFAPND